jgi:hypothetical protein
MTYDEILIPEWCNEITPNNGLLGCWSLISGMVKSKKHCKNCEHYFDIGSDKLHENAIKKNQLLVRNALR